MGIPFTSLSPELRARIVRDMGPAVLTFRENKKGHYGAGNPSKRAS